MLFEPNNMIHLGNYEEFFILYMDNELNDEQMKMVDAFLLAHPDLQAEFEVLMSTKLPLEEFNFDKTELLADKLKMSSVDEDLLLYIDNELSPDKKKIIELEIASNKDYQLQHNILLQARLDPSEKIVYSNKEELYRRTERVVFFKPWMRVAAAVLIIAVSGIAYFRNTASTTDVQPRIAQGEKKVDSKKQSPSNQSTETLSPVIDNTLKQDNIAKTNNAENHSNKSVEEKKNEIKDAPQQMPQDIIAYNPTTIVQPGDVPVTKVTNIDFTQSGNSSNTGDEPKVSINNTNVTSSVINRKTDEPADNSKENLIAGNNNDRKGSVRGFLRKATRMIEKRTGIDPTNEDGKLLIGSVAINLK